jgi:hypothetical protein
VSRREVRDFVSVTRDDLGATLDEIEHRVSPKELSKQAIHWVSTSYDRNPGKWLLGIALEQWRRLPPFCGRLPATTRR